VQTRRDQVQAHTFVAGRLVSAMLRAEPDAPNTPMRRFTVGAFVGVMAGIVLIAGFGIFGYIKPGGKKAFREPGALIVEKETGARYVFVDGELKPVLNFTSAKLILGDDLRVVNTSKKSMKGVPHGLPVGIPAAPDALPDPKDLDATGWQVCSTLKPDVSGEDRPFVTLRIGGTPTATALADDQALIVVTADGTRYLAWKDRRLRIPDEAILGALGYGPARQHTVGPAWVNALPAGPDLKAPNVAGRGEAGPPIGGRQTRVGQLFEVDGAGTQQQFFLLTRDGLAPLSPTGAALVLGDARTKAAYGGQRVVALPLDPAALAGAARNDQALLDPGLPPTPPRALSDTGDAVPCLRVGVGGEKGADVRIALSGGAGPAGGPAGAAGPVLLRGSVGGGSGQPTGPSNPVTPSGPIGPIGPGVPAAPTAEGNGGQADEITVAPGAGLLIRDLPAPGVAGGAESLLVDTGVRYPLPTDDVAGTLGYGDVTAVPVPTTLLSLLPAGRPLDPEAAKTTTPVESQVRAGNNPP
jgi:type VII secretion protein EccB